LITCRSDKHVVFF